MNIKLKKFPGTKRIINNESHINQIGQYNEPT